MTTQRTFELLSAVLASAGALLFAGIGPDFPIMVPLVSLAAAFGFAVLALIRSFRSVRR